MITTRVYCDGVLDAEEFPICDVSEHLDRPDTVVWVDLLSPSEQELDELASELHLGLHELAVEDTVEGKQRAKLDQYPNHLFLSCRAVKLEDGGDLSDTEVDAFIGKRWLVTVRHSDEFPLQALYDRWDRSKELTKVGVPFLIYGLLDVVIDGYFAAVNVFDDYYDEISESIFSEHPLEGSQQRQWFLMRQALVKLHRMCGPTREVVSGLMRRLHAEEQALIYPYYQDLYDHILRVTESSDALRELVSTIVETNLALREHRTNQIMKKVTSWAAVIAVPTLITGYYGMNVPYPGMGQTWGWLVSLVIMVAAAGGLYGLFRRKDWL